MSFMPELAPIMSRMKTFLELRPIAKSVSLYSSLTFVTAVYSLGRHSHTTIASSVAIVVARMYGCLFNSCVRRSYILTN